MAPPQRHPRAPFVMTGNRWEGRVSGDRTMVDIKDLKRAKGALILLNLEDVLELKELVDELASTMGERR